VEYLLLITKPFFDFTNVLSKTRDVTVHHVFSIYNKLFNHLDDAEKKLKRKAVPWKKRMLQALQAAKKKLSKYYTATDTEPYGSVYAMATILCPSKKLRYFDNADWRGTNKKGETVDFMKTYQEVLQKEFQRYQQRVTLETEPTNIQASLDPIENELELLCESQTALQAEVDQPEDEITRYLAKG
jgi:ribosomal protein S15P/S13E